MFLWLKLFHIFFIVAWFAGLFYLPRIFVNLAMADNDAEYARLLLMAQKLYRFMLPWCVGALICGIAMPLAQIGFAGWVHGKICIGLLLLAYHIFCGRLLRDFEQQRNQRTASVAARLYQRRKRMHHSRARDWQSRLAHAKRLYFRREPPRI